MGSGKITDKVRIGILRSEQGRLREFTISRGVVWASLVIALPLSVLGFALFATSVLHDREEQDLRAFFSNQNAGLSKQIDQMSLVLDSAREMVHRLEAEHLHDIERRGIGFGSRGSGENEESEPRLRGDVDLILTRTRSIETFFDSAMYALTHRPELVSSLPTGFPVTEIIPMRGHGHYLNPFTNRKAMHAGADFAGKVGDPVIATGSGKVLKVGKGGHWGHTVLVDHGRSVHSFYAHLDKSLVKPHQEVARGDTIALVGSSGISSGPHLHYELRIQGQPVDPFRYFLDERTSFLPNLN